MAFGLEKPRHIKPDSVVLDPHLNPACI